MITADQFKAAFRLHPAGVALVTGDHRGNPIALTASYVAAVSADPPLTMCLCQPPARASAPYGSRTRS